MADQDPRPAARGDEAELFRASQFMERQPDRDRNWRGWLFHEVLVKRARTVEHVSPRAERLWELERDQPSWLTDRIGSAPRSSRSRSAGQTAARRAAPALDDYRRAIGPRRFDDAAEVPPSEPELRRQHDAARRAIAAHTHARGYSIGRGLGD